MDLFLILPLTMAQTAVADTVVMVVARDVLQIASAWATVVVGVFFLLLIPMLLLLFKQVATIGKVVKDLGERGLRQIDPLVEGGRNITDNLEFVTMAVRTDVERLNASMRSLSDRLQQASTHMEQRIEEFNALMEVVQSEAEDIFIGTAAAVRGVRVGATSLGESPEPSDLPSTQGSRPVEHEEEEDTAERATDTPDIGRPTAGSRE